MTKLDGWDVLFFNRHIAVKVEDGYIVKATTAYGKCLWWTAAACPCGERYL